MINPIHYEEKHFIIVNDISNSLFYFFDFDSRSNAKNMEFEHFHSYYEIHILLSPNALHFIEGIPYHIQTNDFVLLPPSLLHKTSYPEGEPSKRLIITFMYRKDGYGFKDSYEEILTPFHESLPIYRFPDEQLSVLTGLLNRIVELSNHAGTQEITGTNELVLHSIFTEFLFCLNLFRNDNIYKKEHVDDTVSERIYAVCNYIHTHYMEELTLDDLAKQAWMSPYYLSHQFKRITGYTITHYVHLVRIRNCQFLLINSKKKITEIAADCGFTSFSQFNRVFRKFCGESPSDYRRSRFPGTDSSASQPKPSLSPTV
ncbi:MAG TPA: AraC family transcriptional regulator [Candidatus Eisenbergiella merdipullorum]|uniref:AraC family transcriptional regulator n=1 Tax=Candidatus Eisenbergiella merdipullorum TaxID=2838553 RepID=A0A9D2KZA9_9FIRM|nr:AraC family transcriptional regulator [Candidatus Eisenbergiella merdipullorum]